MSDGSERTILPDGIEAAIRPIQRDGAETLVEAINRLEIETASAGLSELTFPLWPELCASRDAPPRPVARGCLWCMIKVKVRV